MRAPARWFTTAIGVTATAAVAATVATPAALPPTSTPTVKASITHSAAQSATLAATVFQRIPQGSKRDFTWLTPARWYPCGQPLQWRLNTATLGPLDPTVETTLVTQAFKRITAVNGYQFQPATSTRGVDITIRGVPKLSNAHTLGRGGVSYVEDPTSLVVRGWVKVDTADMVEQRRGDRRAIYIHELLHALGLSHANDDTQIMYPTLSVRSFGAGDIAGLQAMPAYETCPPAQMQ